MRVLVNGLAAVGARTGIGHYTAETVRAMQALAPNEVVCYKPEWAGFLNRWWAWFRSGVESPSAMRPATVGEPPKHTLRGWFLDQLRQLGLTWYARSFRAFSKQGFDLYHEPNFIPLEC